MEDEEKTLWESFPFIWKYMYWVVTLYVLFTVILVFALWVTILWLVSVIAYGILAVPLIIQFIRWRTIYYKITEKRLVIRRGIFNISEKNVMIDKIENFEVKRSLIDRLFNTGDIAIFTDQGPTPDVILSNLPKIKTVEEILTELLSKGS